VRVWNTSITTIFLNFGHHDTLFEKHQWQSYPSWWPLQNPYIYFIIVASSPADHRGEKLLNRAGKVTAIDRKQGRIPVVVFFQDLVEKKTPKLDLLQESISHHQQIKVVLNSIETAFFCLTCFPIQICAGFKSTHLLLRIEFEIWIIDY